MNISALWERAVLLTMARHGIRSEHIELDQTSMKALCIKKVPAHSSIDAKYKKEKGAGLSKAL